MVIVGIVLFATRAQSIGIISIALGNIGLVVILVLLQRSLGIVRVKISSKIQSEAEKNRRLIQSFKVENATLNKKSNAKLLGHSKELIEKIEKLEATALTSSTEQHKITLDQLQLSNDRMEALSKSHHDIVLGELSSLTNLVKKSSQNHNDANALAPARISNKPKDTDYSESFRNLEKYISGTSSPIKTDAKQPRILFVSSNGAGLGHLTRLNAVDKNLMGDSLFYTMSSAYKLLGKKSHEVVYFPSYGDLKMRGSDWNPLMKEHFSAVARGFKPDIIVFDGTYVYQGVVAVSRNLKIPLIWVQRGCWKKEVDEKSRQRHNASKFAKAVLIPGDYGCEEVVDVGDGLTPIYLPPITLVNRNELLPRTVARETLKLPQNKKLFLIQLGAGNINDISNIRTKAVQFVQELGTEWEPVLVRNPLSKDAENDNLLSIQAYPLSLYYSAFDAGAFAAGYNTVQESIELQLPSVFVPNPLTKTDDQESRAESIARNGLGFSAENENELETAIQKLSDPEIRGQISQAQEHARRAPGASAAADAIRDLLN